MNSEIQNKTKDAETYLLLIDMQ